MIEHNSAPSVRPGDYVRAFDPRTLGVVKQGRAVRVGPKRVLIDFGLTGSCYVRRIDVVDNLGTRPE